jgi:hypothetical protein
VVLDLGRLPAPSTVNCSRICQRSRESVSGPPGTRPVASQNHRAAMSSGLEAGSGRQPYLGSATNRHQLCRGLAQHPRPDLNEDSCRNFLLTVVDKKGNESRFSA